MLTTKIKVAVPRAEKLNLVAIRCGQFDGVSLFEHRIQGERSGKEANRSRDVVNWNPQPHQRLHVHVKHRRTTGAAPSFTRTAAVRVRQQYPQAAADMAQSRLAARRPEMPPSGRTCRDECAAAGSSSAACISGVECHRGR